MEELIDVFEYHFNNGYVLISLIGSNNIYVIEKCIVSSDSLKLVFRDSCNSYCNAIDIFNKFKTTL